MRICAYACMRVCVYEYMRICVYVHVCACAYAYAYTRAVISPPQWGWQKKSCPAARKLRRRVPVAENIATELPDRIPQTPSSELHGEVSRTPLAHRQNCKSGPSVHRRTPTNKPRQPRPPGGRRDATGHFSLWPYPPGDLPPRRLLRYFLQNTPPR